MLARTMEEYLASETGQKFLQDHDYARRRITDLLKKIKHSANTGEEGEFCILTSEECIFLYRFITLVYGKNV